MKRIVIAALLSVFVAAPAVAADGKNSIGVNYGLDLNGVFGIQGEFDISSMVNKAPVSLQVFWKNYSQSYFVPNSGHISGVTMVSVQRRSMTSVLWPNWIKESSRMRVWA